MKDYQERWFQKRCGVLPAGSLRVSLDSKIPLNPPLAKGHLDDRARGLKEILPAYPAMKVDTVARFGTKLW